MASNPVLILNEIDFPIQHTVADGTGIEKGTFCKLTDPDTAVAADTRGQACAGFNATEKIASDGVTKLGFVKRAKIRALLSGSATVGDFLCLEGNDDQLIIVNDSGQHIVAQALETGTDGETIKCYFDLAYGLSDNVVQI